jgi:dihydroorotate dehydrogenase (NAD+) catalytic subunit
VGRLDVQIGSMHSVVSASGCFGYGEEYAEFVDLNRLGAVVVKGISLKPMHGNPPPRIYETPCGMLNSIGLQNIGLRRFLKEKLPFLRTFNTSVIVNILGNSVKDYEKLAGELDSAGVDAIELNVSCPNVKKGGILFGTDRKMLAKLVSAVRKSVQKAVLITKLSPSVSDISEFAGIAEDTGSDAVSLINTIPGLAIDVNSRKPRLRNGIGGLSGPAIKPIAVRMVHETYKRVAIPIIGMGGIMNASDALEFIIAGATAVAVGTANFINPLTTVEIIDGISDFMKQENLKTMDDLTGSFHAG